MNLGADGGKTMNMIITYYYRERKIGNKRFVWFKRKAKFVVVQSGKMGRSWMIAQITTANRLNLSCLSVNFVLDLRGNIPVLKEKRQKKVKERKR